MEKKEFSKFNTLALKGIAIILIIFHHCFRTQELFAKYKVSFFPLNKAFVIQLTNSFKIGVSIFVFLTGYGLTLTLKKINAEGKWKKKEINDWLVTRLLKLLSGFWFVAVLAYIICQALNGMTYKVFFSKKISAGIVQMLVNLLGLSDLFGLDNFNSTWWYMSIAVLHVFTIPLYYRISKKYGYLWLVSAIVFVPRIIAWKYVTSSYISFLIPLIFGMMFADKNLLVKVANYKIIKNNLLNKIVKFTLETLVIVLCYKVFNEISGSKFYEIRYGIIPVILICYLYEFYLDIPVLRIILEFLGKHSMNIFLVHTFYRTYYLNEFTYSFKHWIIIVAVLLTISIITSIIIEVLKKVTKYNVLIEKFRSKILIRG